MPPVKRGFTKIESVDGDVAKKIMKDAILTDKRKSNAGRKPKLQQDKATEPLVFYTTLEQKDILVEYCEKTSIPLSTLVKQLLSEKGIL